MKITLVLAGDEEGGLEKHVADLANGLAERGIPTSMIAHRKYADRVNPLIRFIPVDLASSRRNPYILWKLWNGLRNSGAEIAHAHGSKATSMLSTVLPFLNVKAVATIHARKKNLRIFRRFQRVIAVSRYAAASLSHPNIRIIHNGAPIPRQAPAPAFDAWPLKEGMPRVLAAGRLVPVKGFDILIRSWESIDAQLVIAGDGFEMASLQSSIDQAGLSSRISLLGHREDVASLLAAADLFVISSLDEGGPYTLVEALQANVPVVSTMVGMAPEVLPQGALCPPGDHEALSCRINEALANPGAFRESFKEAFQHAHTQLTLDNCIEKTIDVYRELLS